MSRSMPAPDELSTILTLLRTARGWSQQELARAAGIQASSISNYECGKSRPQPKKLSELVSAMGFPLSAIDLTRRFLQSLRTLDTVEARPADAADATGAVAARIHAVSLEAGKAAAQIASSLLTFALQELPREPGDLEPTPAASAVEGFEAAEDLWAALAAHPFDRRRELIEEERAFRTPGLFDLLCRETERLVAHDPRQVVEAAQLAVRVATRLQAENGRNARRVAYAHARHANGLRASGSLARAEEVFAEADRWWSAAAAAGEPIPPDYEARMLSMRASLRRDQGRTAEALELLDRALAAAGSREHRAFVLINKSTALASVQRLEEAIALLREAEPLVDARQNPRLFYCLRHNRLDYLSKLGRFQEARALVPEVRALCRTLGNDLDLLRLRWSEARIEAGLGQTEPAIAALTEVRKELAARGIAYDAALVSLDLTLLYAQTGWAADIAALACRWMPFLEAEGVLPRVSTALELFRRAMGR